LLAEESSPTENCPPSRSPRQIRFQFTPSIHWPKDIEENIEEEEEANLHSNHQKANIFWRFLPQNWRSNHQKRAVNNSSSSSTAQFSTVDLLAGAENPLDPIDEEEEEAKPFLLHSSQLNSPNNRQQGTAEGGLGKSRYQPKNARRIIPPSAGIIKRKLSK